MTKQVWKYQLTPSGQQSIGLHVSVPDDRKSRLFRERARQFSYDVQHRLCENCGGGLTETDLQAGECTQCGELLDSSGIFN